MISEGWLGKGRREVDVKYYTVMFRDADSDLEFEVRDVFSPTRLGKVGFIFDPKTLSLAIGDRLLIKSRVSLGVLEQEVTVDDIVDHYPDADPYCMCEARIDQP